MTHILLFNDQTEANHFRQQRYYQKLLTYYGGTFPLEYQRRVNRGLEAQRKLRAYWREREGLRHSLNLALLAILMI